MTYDWNRTPARRRPARYRRLAEVTWADRIECRHLVRQARAHINVGFENDLLVDELNADGAIDDLEMCIAELRKIQRLLGKREGES